MTALAANRKTPQLDPDTGYKASWTILNDGVMYSGGLVAIDYTDEAQPAANTQGLRVIGVNKFKKINNADDGEVLPVSTGVYRFANSSTYPIPLSAIGQVAYVEDDQTVASYASAYVYAGLIRDVDSDGVWVEVTAQALAQARAMVPAIRVAKTDDYTVTAAIAFDGRTWFDCDKVSVMEITLPSAVGGMRVGVKRLAATAAHDVTIQAAAGDRIEASDGFCAAGKQIDNTVDAITDVLWLRAVDDTYWVKDVPNTLNFANWVKNDA